jgi:hypothetical protein
MTSDTPQDITEPTALEVLRDEIANLNYLLQAGVGVQGTIPLLRSVAAKAQAAVDTEDAELAAQVKELCSRPMEEESPDA